MKQYKELVEKGRVQFQKELEAITPEVQIGQEGNKNILGTLRTILLDYCYMHSTTFEHKPPSSNHLRNNQIIGYAAVYEQQ